MEDFETIVAFNQAMAQETEGKQLDPATLAAGVRDALRDPTRCTYYVAEVDGVIAGQTMITVEWSDWRNGYFWWIQSVFVDTRFRRRGAFRTLHAHIRNLAEARPDVCGLRLYVHRHNNRAIKTYANLGMRSTEYLLCEEDWSGEGGA
jgi:GNAT superfamily N-acetyltransferase